MTLHEMLDFGYGVDGDSQLIQRLEQGEDSNCSHDQTKETPLHVAVRRRRKSAIEILLNHGADIEAKTEGGKTAYAHAIRRGFSEVVDCLKVRGASPQLNHADQFALAVVEARLDDAKTMLQSNPHVIRTGNPEEDRLLADVAGRNETEITAFLVQAGADLVAPGMDGGSPLHQAAWFGQPENVRILINAGAPLEVFDCTHASSPIGWAVHGAKYSGGAEERESVYVEIIQLLLSVGARLHYPGDDQSDAYLKRLLQDARPQIKTILKEESKRT